MSAVVALITFNAYATNTSELSVNYYFKNESFKNTINYCIGLSEKKRYIGFIKQTFVKYDIPLDLIYLPVIESCYDPYARSPKGALGMWQINYITAIHVGLKEGFLTDERYNWKKSTVAAAKYLLFLKDRFSNWELVLAAYNVGPTFLRNQIKKLKTEQIEKLNLPKETVSYVYKFKALIKYIRTERNT